MQTKKRNIQEYLNACVESYPSRLAIADRHNQLSYKEYHSLIKKAASGLLTINTSRKPILVFCNKNVESVISFLGVVYSGNFYVPLDIGLPIARIQLMIDIISPAAAIALTKDSKQFLDICDQKHIPLFLYEDLIKYDINQTMLDKLSSQTSVYDPLYMVFTSGSTGTPKGVVKSQYSLISFMEEFIPLFHMSDTSVYGNQAPFDFDVSAKDIYAPIFSGGTLQIIPKICFTAPAKLMEFINDRGINTLIWSASALKYVVDRNAFDYGVPAQLHTVLFSGEALHPNVLIKWRTVLPDALYVNLYAPTEVTGNCMYFIIPNDLSGCTALSLGTALPNMEVLVLKDDMNAITEGETGEIYIRGPFLSSGYYNNLAKTKEVFIQNPTHNLYQDMVYRTGDLAKLKDGALYFASRKDSQIKLMGHRIELGEIESIAYLLPFIQTCCCIYDDVEQKIILVTDSHSQHDQELMKNLRDTLPKYMLPSLIFHMDKIPCNDHGKIDRISIKKYYTERRNTDA
jgi:D-alanine--poly(phosphoribitol) ligase subunit 1